MDEFRVEVVNVAEEAERLKEAAKAAAKSKDKEGEEEEEEVVPGIASSIQVNITPRTRRYTKLEENSRAVRIDSYPQLVSTSHQTEKRCSQAKLFSLYFNPIY